MKREGSRRKKENQNCNEINKVPSSPVYHVIAARRSAIHKPQNAHEKV
jgi:hypothetical protein